MDKNQHKTDFNFFDDKAFEDLGWAKMLDSLDKKMPVGQPRRRKKAGWLWWIPSVAFTATLAVILWSNQRNSTTTTTTSDAQYSQRAAQERPLTSFDPTEASADQLPATATESVEVRSNHGLKTVERAQTQATPGKAQAFDFSPFLSPTVYDQITPEEKAVWESFGDMPTDDKEALSRLSLKEVALLNTPESFEFAAIHATKKSKSRFPGGVKMSLSFNALINAQSSHGFGACFDVKVPMGNFYLKTGLGFSHQNSIVNAETYYRIQKPPVLLTRGAGEDIGIERPDSFLIYVPVNSDGKDEIAGTSFATYDITYKIKNSRTYAFIPVGVGVNIGSKFSFETGAMIGYLVNHQEQAYSPGITDPSLTELLAKTSQIPINKIDATVYMRANIKFHDRISVYGGYRQGITDVFSKNSVLTASSPVNSFVEAGLSIGF